MQRSKETPRKRAERTTVKGPSAGIQFFVFPKEVTVHLIVCRFEIVNVGLVWGGSWQLHVSPGTKGSDAETTFTEKQKGEGGAKKKRSPLVRTVAEKLG